MHGSGSTTECRNGGICMPAQGSRQKRSNTFRVKVLSFSSSPAPSFIENSMVTSPFLTNRFTYLRPLRTAV